MQPVGPECEVSVAGTSTLTGSVKAWQLDNVVCDLALIGLDRLEKHFRRNAIMDMRDQGATVGKRYRIKCFPLIHWLKPHADTHILFDVRLTRHPAHDSI